MPATQIDDEIDGAILKQNQDQLKQEGEAELALIEKAADLGVNKPLDWGPVGRIINVKA